MASRRDWTILLVDDNQALADNLREILQDVGYGVKLATSVASARAIDVAFDVALVDVRLPDGEGTALGAELKAKWPDAEVILMTGFASLESAVAAVRAGAWAYLTKPCSPNDLLLAIRQALRHVMLVEEKRELARRTLIAEKMAAVGTLAAGLSHEIRNPLNAASLQLTLLERRLRRLDVPTSEQLLDPLLLVQHEIKRLSEIVADFLQFARPREFVPVPVDLNSVIETVVALMKAQSDAAGLQLQRRPGSIPAIAGDGGLLQQMMVNLILNAIQATPAGGWIRVSTDVQDDEVRLQVEDSGPGIPAPMRQRVFEPFFTTKESGSGLGLPLVYSIVQQHGGSIVVEAGEQGGALFTALLPVSTDHDD